MRLALDPQALADLQYWTKKDPRKAQKIYQLIEMILRTPYEGLGKPEPLKHALAGCWSRRIDHEHRLVYMVEGDEVVILSCRYHY